MVGKVEYLRVKEILAAQLLKKIRARTKSQVVYPGLKSKRKTRQRLESGWTPEMDEQSRKLARSKLNTWQVNLVGEMVVHASSWPFRKPVDPQEVPDYHVVIKEPMDLANLEANVEDNKYATLDSFVDDVRKIFDNARNYNGEGTRYWSCANKLEKFFDEKVREWKSRSE
ncbi:histone acetyltransferase [Coemansia sp. RSA 1285]|nr:histone acetyltransferase [Coemansia sp. RSA 1285]